MHVSLSTILWLSLACIHGGDVAKVRADALPCILATLTKFNIPCHELVLGKPWADVYIDDKAANPTTADLESFIGVSYGLDSRVASLSSDLGMIDARDFNRVELSLPGQVSKRGPADIMAGELYWYLTAPDAARRMVPKLLGVRDGGSEISTQLSFVQGNTFSHMLCNRVLLPKHVYCSSWRARKSIDTTCWVVHGGPGPPCHCKTPSCSRPVDGPALLPGSSATLSWLA